LTPAAHAKEQAKVSKRVENTWIHLNISATMLQNRQVFLIWQGEVFQSFCKRATGTKDDFIPRRQGALWMTSSMVAKIGTGIASGRWHYGWLRPWMTRGGTIDDFIHGCRSLREKKVWSTGHILKIESIFNLKQNHSMNQKMGLILTKPISNFKAGIFSMPTWFFDVNYPLGIN
jgi:hypothetical protein